MEEMYGGSIKGDILNHCYKCKTCGDLVNYRKYRWNNSEDNHEKTEDNEEYDRQSDDSDDQSEGGDDQSEMTVDESGDGDDENEQTGGGHRQTEMDNEAGEDDGIEDQSELDYGGPKCPECGRSKMLDWNNLKAEYKDEKSECGDEQN